MRRLLLLALLLPAPAIADAPYCVVTQFSTQCLFYDVGICQQQAAQQRGLCQLNPAAQQQSQSQPYRYTSSPAEIMAGVSAAGEEGRRRRASREEHEARMRLMEEQAEQARLQNELLRAQIEAAKQAPAPAAEGQQPAPPPPPPPAVEYRCTSPQGAISYAAEPIGGSRCVLVKKEG